MEERRIDTLLSRIACGDTTAFEALYLATKRGVFSFAYSYLHRTEDAEDVMQTVYLKVKLHIGQYTAGTNGRAWLLQITKNTALDLLRQRGRTQSLDGFDVAVEDGNDSVTAVMERVLSAEEQQIVILHVLWGYRHREIAQMLSCPTGTVTSKYKRSIAKLKTALREVEV